MKKGFTILELLVASLLLGMLMTVLTMIFNQSSISWRIGEASVADLDDVSDGIAAVHDVADNLYFWKGTAYLHTSPWDADNPRNLRSTRPLETSPKGQSIYQKKFSDVGSAVKAKLNSPGGWSTIDVGSGNSGSGADTYTVNVMSAGPNRQFDDWDDIWSFPDDFQ